MKIFEQTYYGFEDLYDLSRDIEEAFNKDFNPLVKDIPEEFQGKIKVTIEYEKEE